MNSLNGQFGLTPLFDAKTSGVKNPVEAPKSDGLPQEGFTPSATGESYSVPMRRHRDLTSRHSLVDKQPAGFTAEELQNAAAELSARDSAMRSVERQFEKLTSGLEVKPGSEAQLLHVKSLNIGGDEWMIPGQNVPGSQAPNSQEVLLGSFNRSSAYYDQNAGDKPVVFNYYGNNERFDAGEVIGHETSHAQLGGYGVRAEISKELAEEFGSLFSNHGAPAKYFGDKTLFDVSGVVSHETSHALIQDFGLNRKLDDPEFLMHRKLPLK